ncbi:MAG: Mur ligase family protein [Patescibacteria group bacterium]
MVLEVSSFMSHIIREFQSDYSIFTNFKTDHQNWHTDMQEYLDAKMHIIERIKRVAVVNSQVIDFAHEHNLTLSTPQNTRLFQDGTRDVTDGETITIN